MREPATTIPRLAIDASSVVGPRSGIGHATARLLTALARLWPEDWPAARVLINSPRHPLPTGDPWLHEPCFQIRHTRIPGRLLLRGWQYLHWPTMERLVGPVGLIHAPASYIPPEGRGIPRIVTVHDLYFHQAPHHVDPYGGKYFFQTFGRKLPRVDQIIAVSRFTRDELTQLYPIDPARITVIGWGVDHDRFDDRPGPDDRQHLDRLGIERPYILSVATVEPRKNLDGLIEAYARVGRLLRATHQKLPRLVITGQAASGSAALTQAVERAQLSDVVTLTGYLPDPVLPALYRQALGCTLPSFHEGFGMPVLEAMACGCPTALARSGALPEIAGEAALYFDPRDPESMARELTRLITEPHLRDSLRHSGQERSAEFTWERTARATLDLYRRTLPQDPAPCG
jgi:glycosyltransferase involved in cell wall biosynthesis